MVKEGFLEQSIFAVGLESDLDPSIVTSRQNSVDLFSHLLAVWVPFGGEDSGSVPLTETNLRIV